MLLQTVSNHPVHILNKEGGFSPSSFIPFCTFGAHFIGVKINEFSTPVCNIFQPRNYYDQLCYETDLQLLKDSHKGTFMDQLNLGLTLALDYNEDRQINNNIFYTNVSEKTLAFDQSTRRGSTQIYLNTKSMYVFNLKLLSLLEVVLTKLNSSRA